MKALAVVVMLFLGASLGLALLAFALPTPASAYWMFSWLDQDFWDLAMGSAALAVLFLIASVFVPKMPKDRNLHVPRAVRDIALLGALSGLILFAVFAFYSVVSTSVLDYPGPFLFAGYIYPRFMPYNSGIFATMFNGHPSLWTSTGLTFGETGFAVLTMASACVLVYWLGDGVLNALGRAVAFFAAPVAVAFEVAMLLFAPSQMPVHATKFLGPLSDLLTNWFVLVIASGLLALGLVHRRLGLVVRRDIEKEGRNMIKKRKKLGNLKVQEETPKYGLLPWSLARALAPLQAVSRRCTRAPSSRRDPA